MLRGVIHGAAFLCMLVTAIVFIVLSFAYRFNSSVLVYILSQLLQFGVSSVYHIPLWSPRIKRILQHVDHICIFILISGTQTSVLLTNILTRSNPLTHLALKVSWSISIVGIMKILFMNRLHHIFDLVVYILHGAVIVPFYRIISNIDMFDRILIFVGGFLYVFGGVIFGIERPNFYPRIFGYHELFHVFTVLANLCFGLTITRHYFKGM